MTNKRASGQIDMHILVDEKHYEMLRKLSFTRRVTMSQLIRQLVDDYLHLITK